MSYHVFFAFSQGLARPMTAPKGTLAAILAHVAEVEETLGIKRTRYMDNPEHWDWRGPAFRAGFPDVADEVLCETAQGHNEWVRCLYDRFAEWAKNPPDGGEEITPDQAAQFWPGLRMIEVAPDRWTRDYYRNRMEHLYEVMRGRPSEGVTWRVPKLSPKQAGAVIWLFGFLDTGDIRLEVPRGCDHLASSYDGEYEWCERCGAVTNDDAARCRKRACPVQANWCEEDRPSWYREPKGADAA